MPTELRADAIVDFFKKELRSIKFLSDSDYVGIEERLDTLADTEAKRYQKTEAGRWLWRYFTEKSFRDITDNLRGYGELCRYFDEFVEYENILFALDKNHRDHVIHSIWVMMIGSFLAKRYSSALSINLRAALMPYDPVGDLPPEYMKPILEIASKREQSLWFLIALTHDLGYPIQKTKSANEVIARMVSNFGFLEQKAFTYAFTIVHETAIAQLLKTLASVVVCMPEGSHTLAHFSGKCLDCAKSFERLDHGIMSAYLLQTYMDFVCELGSVEGVPGLVFKDAGRAVREAFVILLLRTISWHSNKYAYSTKTCGSEALLLLSDELDEFSRYSRSTRTNEWINVGCRVEFECIPDSLQVSYTFDNKEIGDDMESFFRSKIGKMYDHFELEDGNITRVSVMCKDIRKADTVEYVYEKTISEHALGVVRRTPGNSTDDIQAFMAGTVDLRP